MAEKRVLVVDDVSIIRAYVKSALKDEPLQVVEASTAQLALDNHAAVPADLILCDVNMPVMNGEEFLRRLRQTDKTTPVVMLTAEGDKGIVGNLIRLGIQGYLLKPFKPALLVDRVRELLGPTAGAAPAASRSAAVEDGPDPAQAGAGEPG